MIPASQFINASNCPNYALMDPGFIGRVNTCFNRVQPGSFEVTSSYRTPADQERLKREGYNPHPNSYHLIGKALDIVFDRLLIPPKFTGCNDILKSIYYPARNYWHIQDRDLGSGFYLPIGISENSNTPVYIILLTLLAVWILYR